VDDLWFINISKYLLIIVQGFMNTSKPDYDFIIINAPAPESQLQQFPGLLMVPLFVETLVPTYNVPSLLPTDTLRISRAALLGIFSGTISNVREVALNCITDHSTQWRDPEIVATNSDIAARLPNATLNVLLRSEAAGTISNYLEINNPSGSNYIMTSTLSSISPSFANQYGISMQFHPNISTLPNFFPGTYFQQYLVVNRLRAGSDGGVWKIQSNPEFYCIHDPACC
jgi:hypothetical protein